MMKSFFKKLAFVMALAMVVSLAAPAAKTAVAAEATAKKPLAIAYQEGAAIKALNLKNVGDKEDLRFLYAPANYKELGTPIWRSSNPDVVDVDNNGVVEAKAAGHATVSVLVGAEVATIDVYSVDMKTFEATIGTPENRAMDTATIEIGEYIDFAFYGIEDYSANRYNCMWFEVDPEDCIDVCGFETATPGLVTAKKAGTAKLTLAVINLVTMQRTDVKSVEITVPAEEPEATPIPTFEVVNLKAEEEGAEKKLNSTQNTVKLRFAKATDVSLDKIQAWEMFTTDDDNDGDGNLENPDKLYEYHTLNVYAVEADDATKTVWTVTMFDDFVDGVRYKVDPDGNGGFAAEEFVASVDAVATVEIVELQSALLEHDDLSLRPAVLDVELYDDCWVDVTTRVVDGVMNNDPANIYYNIEDNSLLYTYGNEWVTWKYDWAKANADLGECIFEEHHYMEKDHYHFTVEFYEDAVAAVTATYEYKDVSKDSKVYDVKPEDQNSYDPGKVVRWTLVEPGKKADWAKVNHVVPADEPNYTIAALILDGRGNYFTTHAASAGVDMFTDDQGVKHTVYWTEDETEDFWSNGYYAKYRAMNADAMLIEEDGTVASYEEAKKIYFALYLYDYRKDGDDFVKQFYANTITVCHPKKLTNVSADKTVYVMTNTQEHEDTTPNAYWSLFSAGTVNVKLNDNLHNTLAREDHALAAEFEIKLELNESKEDKNFAELKRMVEEDFLTELDTIRTDSKGNPIPAERKIPFTADQFTELTNRSQIKFRITEKTTNTYAIVTIVLQKPAAMDGLSAQVYPVNEYDDKVKETLTFDNFIPTDVDITTITASQIFNKKPGSLGQSFYLLQVDKNGRAIGVDNNLFISNTLDVNNLTTDNLSTVYVAAEDDGVLSVGDRVMFVKGPDGKVFAEVNTEYDNPAYSKAEDLQYPMPDSTKGLGVKVANKGTATPATTGSVSYSQYQLVTKCVDDDNTDGVTGEIILAKNGNYQVTIRTVKSIDTNMYLLDADGNPKLDTNGDPIANPNYKKVTFTTSTFLKSTFTVNVNNTLTPVTVKSRDLNKIEASLPTNLEGDYAVKYVNGKLFNAYSSKKTGNDDDMKQYILDAITFNWAEADGEDGVGGLLSPDDILYYTYTVASTNNQIVINSVCFRVPDGIVFADGTKGSATNWYRSEVAINWHLTFTE